MRNIVKHNYFSNERTLLLCRQFSMKLKVLKLNKYADDCDAAIKVIGFRNSDKLPVLNELFNKINLNS